MCVLCSCMKLIKLCTKKNKKQNKKKNKEKMKKTDIFARKLFNFFFLIPFRNLSVLSVLVCIITFPRNAFTDFPAFHLLKKMEIKINN